MAKARSGAGRQGLFGTEDLGLPDSRWGLETPKVTKIGTTRGTACSGACILRHCLSSLPELCLRHTPPSPNQESATVFEFQTDFSYGPILSCD